MKPTLFLAPFWFAMTTIVVLAYLKERKATAAPASSAPVMPEPVPASIDVAPMPLRVFDFDVIVGKVSGTLVLHQSSVTGFINRLLMLDATHGKSKTLRLEAATGKLDEVIKASVMEAKSLGIEIFGKNKKKKIAQPAQHQNAHAKHEAELATGPAPAVKTASAKQPGSLTEEAMTPIIKGFTSAFEGVFVSGKVENHIKTSGLVPEEYSSFTVTLDTSDGPEKIQGNDLKRAIGEAGIAPGDHCRILHIRNSPFANGRSKKLFAIINLKENIHECK